jgi:hypothetical protein
MPKNRNVGITKNTQRREEKRRNEYDKPTDPQRYLPDFQSREKLAQFWDTHSFTDYLSDLELAKACLTIELDKIAIERYYYAPIGAVAYYGALGAIFAPQASGRVTVQVPISEGNEPLLEASLAGKTDEVHLGLPQEYAEDILDAIWHAEPIEQLGAGILRVCCAAHGNIGSSPWFFGALSRILAQLLLRDGASFSDESLIDLMRRELVHNVSSNLGVQLNQIRCG